MNTFKIPQTRLKSYWEIIFYVTFGRCSTIKLIVSFARLSLFINSFAVASFTAMSHQPPWEWTPGFNQKLRKRSEKGGAGLLAGLLGLWGCPATSSHYKAYLRQTVMHYKTASAFAHWYNFSFVRYKISLSNLQAKLAFSSDASHRRKALKCRTGKWDFL